MFQTALWIRHFLSVLLLVCVYGQAYAVDKVVLQLKWEHEFQFAGYYAAQWQGYYEREGLEVDIRSWAAPTGKVVSPLEELLSGRAQFAVGANDILLNKGHGYDLVMVAPIFQRSATALVSLHTTPLQDVEQVSHLRLAAVADDDTALEARAMFMMNGVDAGRVQFVQEPLTMETLLQNKADALITYRISAETRARELGLELNIMNPSDFGVQFYGDSLYTTGTLARRNPDLVERFRRASLAGWRYALDNKAEVAQRIAEQLPRHLYRYDDFAAYNLAFAHVIDDYTFYPAVELGHVNQKRLQRTYDILERLGEIEHPYEPESLLFSKPKASQEHWLNFNWLLAVVALAVLILGVALASGKPAYGLQLVVLLLLLLAEQGLETWIERDHKVQQSVSTLETLATVRSRLEQVISRNLAELTGAAAFIAANPDLTQTEFNDYARNVLKLDPQLINLAAAPDLVIKYIYPLPGNEAALGLNYRNNPQQLPAILRAIEFNEPVVAGPVTLVQGGRALISRAPVRVLNQRGQHRLWGIVSAPIDVASVYREAGLLDPALELKVAIRGKDGLGKDGETFYGRAELFDQPGVVTQSVSFGGGAWQIAAMPADADAGLSTRIAGVRIGCALVGLLIMLLLYSQTQRFNSRRQYQKVVKHHAEFLREVETVAKVGGWRMNSAGVVYELSEQAQTLLGIDFSEVALATEEFAELFSGARGMLARELKAALQQVQPLDLELQSKDQQSWLRLIADPSTDELGNVELVGAIQDISQQKQADAKIEHQANYDGLTNLPNRLLFLDRLQNAMAMSRRNGKKIALLFVDLDNFKTINDNHGHREGDLVLCEAARRVQHCVRASDTVGRHSGDEFTVILNDLESERTAANIAEMIVVEMSKAFKLHDVVVYSGASVGIAMFPGDAKSAEELLINADQAMYEVKKSGRNGWHFYTDEMQRQSEYRHQLNTALITAINREEMTFHLQPIVDTRTGKTTACEALARWQRRDGKWVSPGEFVPLAEETGLINQLDYLIMDKAIAALTAINAQRAVPIALSVNVSPRLFQTKDQALDRWLDLVRSACRSLPIVVEITERLLTAESTRTEEVLHELAGLGIGISIDDFGTGYSSLSYLTRFPVNKLKIDRSFVNCIGVNTTSETLIETILAMADKLGLNVVAEGVETQLQLDYLKRLNCHSVQGFFLGRPMSAQDFASRIRQEEEVA
ncbi:MAG: EAL domain-containing protein [Ketobacter sp.]|nr:MAG: EAL domain-containing protein [Ketobacter sp.]